VFLESFKITVSGVGQIFLLGAIGYFLLKKKILSSEGLTSLSRMVIDVTLPILIFCQLLKDFSFRFYPDWWIFPLISIAITCAGLIIGYIFSGLIKGEPDKLGVMFIYLFLFLFGFNLVMFSLGTRIISFDKKSKFELAGLFSPPVIATALGLLSVYFGLNKMMPPALLKPLSLAGECTLPLAMFVVGANLAEIRLGRINKKEMFLAVLAKLIIMPALGILLMLKLNLPELMGLLIIIQLSMPAATLLSVITRQYKKEDLLISQGIFLGHIASIVTIPLFLSLYFSLKMIK
jgi:predicted permease